MRVAVVLIGLLGCAPSLGTSESAIRGGTIDEGDPAVVALSVAGVYSYCSAALIAPHTLLTAGHCKLLGMVAELGTEASAPTQSIDVADTIVHPMYTGEGKPYDFALMKLASDPVGIAPLRLNDEPVGNAELGQMIRHVGFGVTDDSTSAGGGTRRTVTYPLNMIGDILLYSGATGEQTCSGDSGAPGFMTLPGRTHEVIVGVVSDGPDCQLSQDGWDDRVDVVKDWIVATVSAWDAPPSFGDGSGSGSDPTAPPDAGVPPDAGDPDHGATSSSGGCNAGGGAGVVVALALVGLLTSRSRSTDARRGPRSAR